jgi:hypothetical protein
MGRTKLNKKIFLDEREIEFSKNIKYLGIIIDKNLTFKQHLEHLEDKINKILVRINNLSYLKTDLELKYKKRIYYSVFLPTILYGSKIWFEKIEAKTTYLNKIRILQNRIIKNLTRVYKCTETRILFKLFKIVDVVDEIKIHLEIAEIAKDDRKNFKNNKREILLNKINISFENLQYNFNIEECRHRYTLWCLTGTGPFKSFLFKINRALDDNCRYCYYEIETAQHLLYECNKYINLEFVNFEQKCIYIVSDLFKNKYLVDS